MKTHTFLILFALIGLSGCFNDRGISLRYYNDCEEYYDAQGYYHKKCDKNLVDYKEITDALQPAQNPEKGSVR
ncbi:MAG: hypothetical protein AB7U44_02060 [Sulfuricurvum sp.]|uniref:hypothetical protein n=1 Tax=Sulfuricurvum sp. TaxID=2025608 RepID=UPI00262F8E0A|nr:hypothetical protein [Sulfuricurvum sp.]MDD2837434.1 hypothetical protein [Sulfuricurvum sp.]MDD3595108.1 hypothetical protein [Sulfuricurvum sp.]MDD4884727.1 hypothetical protein [Sulfuricurvum sp.]